MSDLLPEHGAPPWLPAGNVTPVMTLNEYDVPLAGLLRQNNGVFLFACLLGEMEDLNVWAYAPVSDQEAERLGSLTDDELSAAIDQALSERILVVALAHDYELADWIRIDSGIEGPLAIAKRFVDQLTRRLAQTQRQVHELSELRELASA